ncbi:MAG: uncharacterized protein KVP18_004614 [Porospora cf. gigantea A]|uniref:uncharacterized protein n=1 Tax=Porospora cf. gigantea A TaxID=2853593 RepID=UPI00355A689E|nr:MAG: hypothetical protein KVP18_004614 [Porospora cf. gigantea A]
MKLRPESSSHLCLLAVRLLIRDRPSPFTDNIRDVPAPTAQNLQWIQTVGASLPLANVKGANGWLSLNPQTIALLVLVIALVVGFYMRESFML